MAQTHSPIDLRAVKLNLGLVELLAGNAGTAAAIFEELLATHGRNGRFHLGYGFERQATARR